MQVPKYSIQAWSMMTSSNGNIFRITGHLCGEFTNHRWIPCTSLMWSFDVFFDLRLNKWLSTQSWDWWFETSSRSLWRQHNAISSWHHDMEMFSTLLALCVRGNHQWLVNSPHTIGQQCGPLMLACTSFWTNNWVASDWKCLNAQMTLL